MRALFEGSIATLARRAFSSSGVGWRSHDCKLQVRLLVRTLSVPVRGVSRFPSLPARTYSGQRAPALTPQHAADQPGSPARDEGAARCRRPRRFIVSLPAATSRSFPAVASHAIGSAEPRRGVRSPGFGACENDGPDQDWLTTRPTLERGGSYQRVASWRAGLLLVPSHHPAHWARSATAARSQASR